MRQLQNSLDLFMPLFIHSKEENNILDEGWERLGEPALFPWHILIHSKDCVADKNVFHATKYSSQNLLRTREDAKSSNIHESVQVLHLLPFISLWTSPAGVCRSNIFVGSSAFLSHLLLLPLPTLSSLSFSHWGISTPLREPLMNTGAHLELRDPPRSLSAQKKYINSNVMSSESKTKGKLRKPTQRDAFYTRACKSDDFRWRLWACLYCDPRFNRFPVRQLFFPEVY